MSNLIQKISGIILAVILCVTVVVSVLFYCGGEVPEMQRIVYNMSQPSFTDLFIDWMLGLIFFLFAIVLLMGLFKLGRQYGSNARLTLISMGSIVALLLLMFVTWLLGNGKVLPIVGYDGHYNTPFWLRTSDMWLSTISVLLLLTVGLIAGFEIRKYLIRRKEH